MSFSLTERLNLLHQNRRLLSRLYQERQDISYSDLRKELGDDPQKLQALLDQDLIIPTTDGYQLHPTYRWFFEEMLSDYTLPSPEIIKHHLEEALAILNADLKVRSFEDLTFHLSWIHQRILDVDHPREIFPAIMPNLELWKNLIWIRLKGFWNIKEAWDRKLIELWEEAEEIEEKLAAPYTPLPDFILKLKEKRRREPEALNKAIKKSLVEEKALFWEDFKIGQSRVSLDFWETPPSFAVAKKARGRKKINLPESKGNLPSRGKIEQKFSPILVQEIMEAFKSTDKDLQHFIKNHERTKEWDSESRESLFYALLFSHKAQLRIESSKKKNIPPKVYPLNPGQKR